MLKRMLVIIVTFFSLWLYATPETQNNYELSEYDITQLKDFDFSRASLFGVKLNMSQNEVFEKLKSKDDLIIKDEKENSRIRISNKKPDGSEGSNILLIVWNEDDKTVKSIRVYSNFKQYLLGSSKELLDPEVIDETSYLTKHFLGRFNKTFIQMDSDLIDFKITNYYYNDKNLIIIITEISNSISVSLDIYNPQSGENNTDFRNTRWGMSLDEVKNSEENQPTNNKNDLLVYINEIAGLSCKIVYIFADNKLTRAKYVFTNEHSNKNDFIVDYNEMKELLSKKYGVPYDKELWKNDLYKDDYGQWGFAISLGHLMYYSEWATPNTSIKLVLNGENYNIDFQLEYSSSNLIKVEKEIGEKKILDKL